DQRLHEDDEHRAIGERRIEADLAGAAGDDDADVGLRVPGGGERLGDCALDGGAGWDLEADGGGGALQAVEMAPAIDGTPAGGPGDLVDAVAVQEPAVEDRDLRPLLVDDLPVHVHSDAHPPTVAHGSLVPPATCRTRRGGDNTARDERGSHAHRSTLP